MFNKIKSIFNKEKCFCDQCSDSIISHIKERKKRKNLSNRPERYSEKEWKDILDRITYALDKARSSDFFRSTGRRRQMQRLIQEGFDLLRIHYKDL